MNDRLEALWLDLISFIHVLEWPGPRRLTLTRMTTVLVTVIRDRSPQARETSLSCQVVKLSSRRRCFLSRLIAILHRIWFRLRFQDRYLLTLKQSTMVDLAFMESSLRPGVEPGQSLVCDNLADRLLAAGGSIPSCNDLLKKPVQEALAKESGNEHSKVDLDPAKSLLNLTWCQTCLPNHADVATGKVVGHVKLRSTSHAGSLWTHMMKARSRI